MFRPCRKPPSYEKHKKKRGHERARKHQERLTALTSPLPPVPSDDGSSSACSSTPAPCPPVTRSSGFANQLAADFSAAKPVPREAPTHSPSNQYVLEGPSDDSVSPSPSPPGSPIVCCSQYRQAQHDEEMATVEEGNESQMSPPVIDLDEDENLNVLVYDDDGQLHVRTDYRNRMGHTPLCYIDTGYRGLPAPDGKKHQGYMVYNKVELEWARRLRFHLRRFQA